MSKTNALPHKSEPAQRRLVVVSSQDQEVPDANPKMLNPPTTLNNVSTQTAVPIIYDQGNLFHFSTMVTAADDKADSSSTSETSESPSQKRNRRRKEIKEEVERLTKIYPPGSGFCEESDQAITLNITIHTYGKPDVAMDSVLLNMGRALHNAFGNKFEMRNMDGIHILYDALAHDGKHVGHNEALTFSEVLRVTTDAE